MAEIIDISVALQPDTPLWPGSTAFVWQPTMQIAAGAVANVSMFQCDSHMGTHVDAPHHFIDGGKTMEQLPLDVLIGEALVVHLPDVAVITAAELEALALPPDVRRLLLRTRNSDLWTQGVQEFRTEFVALTADAAQWVVDRGIRLIGVDYLSVQRFSDGPQTHQILLGAEVIILETLNLAGVSPGRYELLCLPLNLAGSEASPARAVLRRLP